MTEPSPSSDSSVLSVRGVSKHFPVRKSWSPHSRGKETRDVLVAVNHVDLDVERAQTLGLVGESGCGKSTLGKVILRLLKPTAGNIVFEGQDITQHQPGQMREIRKRLQIVFQDPYSSLNPRLVASEAVAEPMRVHGLCKSRKEENDKVDQLFEQVGLRPEWKRRYPHEFSGGQRQRLVIARALSLGPSLIVADEPVSALDVSVQAQILNLLRDLQEQRGIAFLFVAHDLAVVRHVSHRVAVMYLGAIVENAEVENLYAQPLHPYTQALLQTAPRLLSRSDSENAPAPASRLEGEVPSPLNPPSGCSFHPRCPKAEQGLCDKERPALRELAPGHWVACHLAST